VAADDNDGEQLCIALLVAAVLKRRDAACQHHQNAANSDPIECFDRKIFHAAP
jgi:ABC-type transporter lipoprotein component MlaA